MNKVEIVVDERHHNLRLDKFLTLTTAFSRTRLQELLKSGAISVEPCKPLDANTKVKSTEKYTLIEPLPIEADPTAQDIPLNIIYEDEHLLVLNKPANFVVHPAPGHSNGTLVNALLHHCGDSLSGIGGVKRPGIIHRLDKDTSGILVVAKSDAAHQGLSKQFHDREDSLEKIYLCLVWGRPYPTSGLIDAPIARHPRDRQKMAIQTHGKTAQTSYKTLKHFTNDKDPQSFISFLQCTLHTGRTHQIRVHTQHLGTPIIGDQFYSKKAKKNLWPEFVTTFPRQALHAYSLKFTHPITHENHRFDAPLADDINQLLIQLEAR